MNLLFLSKKHLDMERMEHTGNSVEGRYAFGQKGMAKFLNCSVSKVQKDLKKGCYEGIVIQLGRKMLFDLDKFTEKYIR